MPKIKGVTLPHEKKSASMPGKRIPCPETAVYPMQQHIGRPAAVAVKPGDRVYVGTLLGEDDGHVSSPIYSGISGTVKRIDNVLMSGGRYTPAVVVESDSLMEKDPSLSPPVVNDKISFLDAVRKSGVVGLGGAGFPTSVKLEGKKDFAKIDYIVVNGAECEPYITSDTRTMLDHADLIRRGAELLAKYLEVENIIVAIEKNKPQCIKKMREVFRGHSQVTVRPLRSMYPQGAEKVLAYNTTGRIIREGQLPIDQGVIIINCTTLAKIAEFIDTGIPLVEKCVTVDGPGVAEPANLIVPIGTPLTNLISACRLKSPPAKVLYGGPMMGISVPDTEVPVLKSTNAVTVFDEKSAVGRPSSPCIRCGRCTNVCPLGLAPVSIAKAYTENDMEALAYIHAGLCMECGCCSYVCPAARPLVQQNRLAKAALAAWEAANKKSSGQKEGGK